MNYMQKTFSQFVQISCREKEQEVGDNLDIAFWTGKAVKRKSKWQEWTFL